MAEAMAPHLLQGNAHTFAMHNRIDSFRPGLVSGLFLACAALVIFAAQAADGATPTPTPTPTPCLPVITQSASQTITALNSGSCNNGGIHTDNSYWRAFNMATFTGSRQYNVTSVSFGVEVANVTQQVLVRLYTTTNFPTGFPGSLTPIASTIIDVTNAQSGTMVTTPLVATVPAGTSQLVMELFTPDGQATRSFFVGSNAAAQTGPSYISARDCGLATPTDVATTSFSSMHIVFDVNGSCGAATSTPTPSPTVTATPAASATPTATGTPAASPTPTPGVTPAPSPTPTPAAQAINLSTRMRVQTGNNVGIGGFIITGTAPKHVLLRAIGPSLTQFGVPNALADPVLELHGPGAFATITDDNWRDDPVQEAAILATGIPPTNDLESAIDATLVPGNYTAIVQGKSSTSGVALIEVYDLNQEVDSKLVNLSTRAFVSTGDDIVIAGFLLSDNGASDRVVVRGIGPSLTAAGVPDALADPTLELHDSNGTLLIANNDWQDNAVQAAEITAAGLAPTNNLESGIAATLPPGLYTALLAGQNNGTGIGLVEVYDRGAP